MEINLLWINCSIWPPLCLVTSSTPTVMLITWRQIPSVISLQAWMISALNSVTVCSYFGKILSLRNPPKKQSYGFKSGLFVCQFCLHAKRSGNRFEMTHESKVSCRKSKTIFTVCGLASSCMNHWVCNSKPVARRWDTKVLQHAWVVLTVHCLFKGNWP
jgi:hypothetical protein